MATAEFFPAGLRAEAGREEHTHLPRQAKGWASGGRQLRAHGRCLPFPPASLLPPLSPRVPSASARNAPLGLLLPHDPGASCGASPGWHPINLANHQSRLLRWQRNAGRAGTAGPPSCPARPAAPLRHTLPPRTTPPPPAPPRPPARAPTAPLRFRRAASRPGPGLARSLRLVLSSTWWGWAGEGALRPRAMGSRVEGALVSCPLGWAVAREEMSLSWRRREVLRRGLSGTVFPQGRPPQAPSPPACCRRCPFGGRGERCRFCVRALCACLLRRRQNGRPSSVAGGEEQTPPSAVRMMMR